MIFFYLLTLERIFFQNVRHADARDVSSLQALETSISGNNYIGPKWFKHAVLGTHLGYLGCLSRQRVYSLLDVI